MEEKTLKNLLDLKFYMDTYSESIDWNLIIIKSKSYKIYKVMILGFYLLNKHFESTIPDVLRNEFQLINSRLPILIEKYWLHAKMWADPVSRIKYERIFCMVQDEGFLVKKIYLCIFFNLFYT